MNDKDGSRAPLAPVVHVDLDRCVNCHACIAVCPVKDCNRVTDRGVELDSDLCIGCGECLDECRHEARKPVDDRDWFLESIRRGEKWIAIVAPAVAANFPGEYLRLNGWLRSMGVAACFDVSFGAELTVKSYLAALENGQQPPIIAQPCPAIVTYIETYRPELIPYLAPADSPMLHIAKWIRETRPELDGHRMVAISPCTAKKREFEATGIVSANVTMRSLREYLQAEGIDLRRYEEAPYENPPVERAVLFSSPGGLLKTAERWDPGISGRTRKIEGPQAAYKYLDTLPESIRKGIAPELIDILNCEHGCNGGTGTDSRHCSPDELEARINERRRHALDRYGVSPEKLSDEELQELMKPVVEKNWREGLFGRTYEDRSERACLKQPTPVERKAILDQLGKFNPEDMKHCHACGYKDCDHMVKAIHNGHNQAASCHFYREFQVQELQRGIAENFGELSSKFKDSAKDADSLRTIVQEVDRITMQTHMLAVNGAVEASRAGEFGRGFGVISEEMRSLSEMTRNCSGDIDRQIDHILEAFRRVGDAIDEAAGRLKGSETEEGGGKSPGSAGVRP